MNPSYTVLVVDDDKFLLEMYRKKFEKKGVNVELSVGSLDALTKLRAGMKPDIILLDIIMPGMDGLELLETMRKEKLSPTSLVIMLTNESDSDRIKRAETLGVAGYLVKASNVPSEVADKVIDIANSHLKQ